MPRKVIDIVASDDAGQQEEQPSRVILVSQVSKPQAAKKQKRNEQPESKERKRKSEPFHVKKRAKRFSGLPKISLAVPIVIGGVVVILAAAFLVLTANAKLALKVKPVLEPIKMEEEVQVSPSQKELDFEKRILPGQILETEAEKWQTFKSTGKETEQMGASGTIFVYNSINPPMPLSLKEGTRFLSSKDGKIFKAKSKVILPSATLSNGKITPSITEVAVVAQQEGEEYNIAPAKFSVPGLAGTALYYSVWGESKQKIEGGSEKEVDMITQADLERAQDDLNKTLKEMAIVALQQKIPQGFVLKTETVSFEESDFSCSQKAGEKLPEFNCYSKIKAKAIVFKSSDLDETIKSFITSTLSSNKKLYPASLMTTISPKGVMAESGSIVLGLKVEAKLYNDIEQQSLISEVAGKGQGEIKNLIADEYSQIERTDFAFWPFWVKKAPKNIEKIKLDIIFSP